MGTRFFGAVICFAICTSAWALDLDQQRQFDIPAQKLSTALVEFSRQAKAPVVSSTAEVERFNSPGVTGRMSLKDALKALLQGTALDIRTTESGAIAVGSFGAKSGAAEGTAGQATRVAQTPGASRAVVAMASDGMTEGGNTGLTEIIVTAQKRNERIQDVPMSLTALSGEQLERTQSYRLEDFVGKVPGLTLIDDGALGSQLVIRGITSGVNAVNSSVATYVDETPYTTQGPFAASFISTPNIDTFDMQRIEVLRGPQGTFYGANAMGGLLKYVTNAPDPSAFAAKVETSGSAVDHGGTGFDVHGMVNVPIADDLAFRVVAYDTYYPGFIDDPSRDARDVNGSRITGTRASLLYQPMSSLSIRFNAFYQDREWNDWGTEDVTANTLTPLYGDWVHENLIGQPGHATTELYNATVTWDAGPATLLSTTSYYDERIHYTEDYSKQLGPIVSSIVGSPSGLALQLQFPIHALTEELRLSSPDQDILHWLVGGYFTDEHAQQLESLYPVSQATKAIEYNSPTNIGSFNFPNSYREYAGFVNLDYHLTSTFDVGVGGRYSENHQDFHETGLGIFGGGADFGNTSSQGVFTYSADARWHVAPENMLYARVASGYVPGGPNNAITTATVPNSYAASTAVNYEFGVKSSLLDNRLSVEISAFLVTWDKIQLVAFIGGEDYTANAGAARSEGVEWNFAYTPLRGLTFNFNGAYTDAYLTQATPASVNGAAGARLPAVPLWQSSAGLEYQRPLFGEYSGVLGADWRFTGERYADFEATGPRQQMPSFNIVDLRAGIESKRWNVVLFAKNAFNKVAINYVQPETLNGGLGPQAATLYPPRTVGVSLSASF